MPPLVLTACEGAVTTVTLNCPDTRNALGAALLDALRAVIAEAERDPAQRVFVLRGAGKVFCSGLDLAEAAKPGCAAPLTESFATVLRALGASRLVSLAVVQGAAIGGGAGLMSACDFVVATRDAKFGYPELRRGIVPALLMPILRRQLRERDARELLLLGKLFDAEHALAIGLINRVAADAVAAETEVRSLVSSLLQGAPEAAAETKRFLAELWPAPFAADLERARTRQLTAIDAAEAREGVAAFNAKRPARLGAEGVTNVGGVPSPRFCGRSKKRR